MQAGFPPGWDMERGSWIEEGRRGKEVKEEGGDKREGVPRKCALFFQRLSILERATDHECINNHSFSKRNVGRIQVQRPCEFFLREEVFQI